MFNPIERAVDKQLSTLLIDPEAHKQKPENILIQMCDQLKWKPPPGKRKRRRRRTIKTLH
jgi:hypothetical protein